MKKICRLKGHLAPYSIIATFVLLFFSQSFAEAHADPHVASAASAQESMVSSGKFITDMRQMTFVGPRAGEGYFSQDGRFLIFQSERESDNPFYQIYVLDRDNGKTVRVSPGSGKTTCAWVHPSKAKALFSSTHLDPKLKEVTQKEWDERKNPVKGKYSWSFDENFELFEAPIASALKSGKPVEAKSLKRLTAAIGYDAEGSYSPDGKTIAFASNRAGYLQAGAKTPVDTLSEDDKKLFNQDPSYMMDLYLMNADGSNIERLTTARGYDGGPFFSADGTKLTWRRFSANGQMAEIMVMDLKTRKETQITKMKVMSWAPFFHPSGDYIIFTSNKLGYTNFELFIVDTEGKHEPVRVSTLEGFDGLPVFLPNGRELSWTRKDEKGESQIYIAKWDDGLARASLGLGRRAPDMTELSPEIREDDAKAWVSYLTSPEFKGRRPGTKEERQYADGVARAFRSMGLEPAFGKSFVQAFEFTAGVELGPLNRLRLRIKGTGQDLKTETDWMPLSISKSGDVMEAPIVFAGYGISAPASDKIAAFDSYENLDPHGKWVVVLSDLPDDLTPEKRFHFHLYARAQHKALVAKQKGAVGLIVVDPRAKSKSLSSLKFEGASEVGLPVIQVSQAVGDLLFSGAKTRLKDKLKELDRGEVWNQSLETSIGGKVDLKFIKSTAMNVAARKPGSNKKLAPLVIGAHGDHLGLGENASSLAKDGEKGEIHFGADDNASGVAALMETAHTWTKRKPDRDIVFAMWSAEELGVLGSTYYLKNLKEQKNPLPVAYLNMDMVGRLRDSLSVQGIGSAKEWPAYLEAWTTKWPLAITTTSDPYLPTDAMPFYVNKVPIMAFFTGAHAEYHSPRDRYETLNFKGLIDVANLVDSVSQNVSRTAAKLTWVKVDSGKTRTSGEGRSFRLYLGTVPDYSQEGVKGVKISGTSKDSPAEQAGLKAGDVIVGLGGITIDSIYDYVYCLQALKADVAVPIRVVRSGQSVEMQITPRLKK